MVWQRCLNVSTCAQFIAVNSKIFLIILWVFYCVKVVEDGVICHSEGATPSVCKKVPKTLGVTSSCGLILVKCSDSKMVYITLQLCHLSCWHSLKWLANKKATCSKGGCFVPNLCNAFTLSSDVLVKIGQAICPIFDLVLLGGQFNNTLQVYKLWYFSICVGPS